MNDPLNIVAGESIPYVQEAFTTLGKVTMLSGRSITTADLNHTDVLLVRSITKINEALLQGSAVKFVGSASAGIDHVDTAYLQSQKIGFASSPGGNANSVAEYVITALLIVAHQQNCTLAGKSIGIVGVGNIGKLVKQKAEALGMTPILNDPLLAETSEINNHSLEDTLKCDIVTLHVPLTKDGPFPTHHLINKDSLKWLKPSTIFINASRGEVVETQALLNAIRNQQIGPTVLDVWEHEPQINWDLFEAVTLGTPHIAGHSLDGKAAGTFMIYAALCTHLGVEPTWNPSHSLPAPLVPSIDLELTNQTDEEALRVLTTRIYDLEVDYSRMKALLAVPIKERPALFDGLRKNYPVRREFHRTNVHIPSHRPTLTQHVSAHGFLHE